MTGELWFYHLERTTLADALPELLEKTLAKGWRALVRAPVEDRIAQLDAHLWTFRDDAFLGHATADVASAERQPILLTTHEQNANNAHVLFTLDGVMPDNPDGFERCAILFDGGDETAVSAARDMWRKAKGEGRSIAYWKQSVEGRWEKKA